MYGIFTYIWLLFMVNVGKYTSGIDILHLLTSTSPPPQDVDDIYGEVEQKKGTGTIDVGTMSVPPLYFVGVNISSHIHVN